jgi:Mg2+ and Co2+ transporter CorA
MILAGFNDMEDKFNKVINELKDEIKKLEDKLFPQNKNGG